MKKKILLFGDPGIEDPLVIIYTLMNPDFELVGIVTSYGNVPKEQATANAYYNSKFVDEFYKVMLQR